MTPVLSALVAAAFCSHVARRIAPRNRAIMVGSDAIGPFAHVMTRRGLDGHLRGQAWRSQRWAPTREERAKLVELANASAAVRFPAVPVIVAQRRGVVELMEWV